ncbi:hypothetical protein CC86DRAFT_385599 [Ophiobolus disseminans]|uniref:Uncharacterized protein n=1 Tax=Ophiobolus disseminans TaxID=1469910 RepID=A0A6A6ZP86_9PLEO|nr:hypothetical protein CC86DRAFT_385599 [Ophiobolus disseminans]
MADTIGCPRQSRHHALYGGRFARFVLLRPAAARLWKGSEVLVGQHGFSRLRLNWMNLFYWGIEPRIASRGLDAGKEPPGYSERGSTMAVTFIYGPSVTEERALAMEGFEVAPCRRSRSACHSIVARDPAIIYVSEHDFLQGQVQVLDSGDQNKRSDSSQDIVARPGDWNDE